MQTNKIYCENNLFTMSRMKDNSVDLTVTSPPYDNLRKYNGYCFDFENLAKELFRVTKNGGVWYGLLVMQQLKEVKQVLALSRHCILLT